MSNGTRIVGFETRYLPTQVAGKLKEVDYVNVTAVGMAKYTVTPIRIVDAQRDTTGLWDMVGPAYEKWKSGQDPRLINGTPLSAWNAATKEQREALHQFDVRSIEDLAEITDAVLQKIGLPGIRNLRDAARAWIGAKDVRDVAEKLSEKDAEIQALQEQMAEMMALMREQPAKRGPGRPRKETVEEDEPV